MRNFGLSFGWQIPGVVWLSAIVWLVIVYWWWQKKSLGLGLIILGGGLNLGERIVKGYVWDYWQIGRTGIYNNINDWFIFVGLILFLWSQWKQKSK